MGAGGAKIEEMVSRTGGEEEGTDDGTEGESNTIGGRGGTGGTAKWDESSAYWRIRTPCLYILSVIFVLSKGTMPALANP